MIKCTVCLAENDDFAIVCSHCKAFLQDRVPNLDLFATAWKVLEDPRRAFRVITLAEHKNYALFLFALFGVSLSFTGFWYFRLGNRFESLLDLIPTAVGVGVILGAVMAAILSLAYYLFAKSLGGASGFRTSLAVLGYSLTPIALSLLFILPVELLTFGMYLFTSNPHPYTIKPLSYVLLVGFDALVAVWSIVLAVIGTMVGHQLGTLKSILTVVGTFAALVGTMLVVALLLQLSVTL